MFYIKPKGTFELLMVIESKSSELIEFDIVKRCIVETLKAGFSHDSGSNINIKLLEDPC